MFHLDDVTIKKVANFYKSVVTTKFSQSSIGQHNIFLWLIENHWSCSAQNLESRLFGEVPQCKVENNT